MNSAALEVLKGAARQAQEHARQALLDVERAKQRLAHHESEAEELCQRRELLIASVREFEPSWSPSDE